ncbi:MAG TPA: thiamine phosphate synthase [Methylomirabilota bacterium]|nr:thiamine phosphate synthase [Methylomirabilota bacterium]
MIPPTLPRDPKPILCYVTDRRALVRAHGGDPEAALRAAIRRAVTAGVDSIQIREKDLCARALAECVRAGVADARGSATKILVNDRLDVAIATQAAGAHFGEASLPLAAVTAWRTASGARMTLGVSCHSLESCLAAERVAADYVLFGPVFATPSKESFGPPQGLDRLARVCRSVRLPVIAIGGVKESNAESCFAAGAAGIAAIRLFQEASDLTAVVSQLRRLRPSA